MRINLDYLHRNFEEKIKDLITNGYAIKVFLKIIHFYCILIITEPGSARLSISIKETVARP